MIANKPAKPKSKQKPSGANGKAADWRESLRRRLTKVPEVEGIFIVKSGGTVHVFTVMEDHVSEAYGPLMKQESLVEKDHPSVYFDFHTRVHQGRPPHQAVPYGAEMVFLKK
jgi:hypothetical protein